MNDQEIDIKFIMNSSQFLEKALSPDQPNIDLTKEERMHSQQQEEVSGKVENTKKRARNILSSRKYRAKRRERMKILEDTNQYLAMQIKSVEDEVDGMKRAIHRFVRHASTCEECGNLQIRFE